MSNSTTISAANPTTNPPAATSTPDPLLRDFLLSPDDLFSLADKHHLSLDALIAWWTDPATKARIRALEDIAESRRDLRAKLHAAKAIDRLSALSESTGNQPNERRQCASALLRHTPRPPRRPGRANAPADEPVGPRRTMTNRPAGDHPPPPVEQSPADAHPSYQCLPPLPHGSSPTHAPCTAHLLLQSRPVSPGPGRSPALLAAASGDAAVSPISAFIAPTQAPPRPGTPEIGPARYSIDLR